MVLRTRLAKTTSYAVIRQSDATVLISLSLLLERQRSFCMKTCHAYSLDDLLRVRPSLGGVFQPALDCLPLGGAPQPA